MRQVLHINPVDVQARGDGIWVVSARKLGWDLGRGWPNVFLYDGSRWFYRTCKCDPYARYKQDSGGMEIEVTR